jgi:hypothetical protein
MAFLLSFRVIIQSFQPMGILGARRFFVLALFVLAYTCSRSQGGLYPVSSDEKIRNSTIIAEGKVISKKSFWNTQHSMIFTSNQVEVYKLFKGSLQKNTINIITVGGAVDNLVVQASHQLTLELGEIGVFFCKKNNTTAQNLNEPVYDVYSSSQGFLKYDLSSKIATSPFEKYDDIEKQVYHELHQKTGRSIEVKNTSFSVDAASRSIRAPISSNSTLAPVITSFSPATVYGGAYKDATNNVLTINGTGFGAVPSASAAVLFPHADQAAGNFYTLPFDSSNVLSWNDTQIKVRVPSQAGTGIFQVRDNGGVTVNAPSTLTVMFTLLSAWMAPFGAQKQFNLGNINGTGGYSIKYSTNTANSGVDISTSPAQGTFQRALNTWKEVCGANIAESGTTTIQAIDPNDGVNVVTFDNAGNMLGGPMPAGVLASCYSYSGYCSPVAVGTEAVKSGFDIIIRNSAYSTGSTPFTFGPCSPYNSTTGNVVDLETVLLHELGHALDMGHIIDAPESGAGVGQTNPAKLMHFSVSYNVRRISPDYSAKAGAVYTINPHGYNYGGCVTEMTPLATTLESKDECPVSFPTTTTPLFTSVAFDLVHATSNKYGDPGYGQITTDATTTSITNTAFYAFKTNAAGGDLSLEVTNYTTVPASLASCTLGTSGVPVTGIQMSLYKVAACPTGQSFPTPVVHNTFKANGIIPAITGLSANSTYLLFLDGVENTKATFNIVFSGSSLPLRFNDFSGAIFDAYNQLSWSTDKAFEVTSLNLERSADGVTFNDIDVVTDPALQATGSFNDTKFLPGANYYRLAVHNSNGSIEYSKVVLLTRAASFRVNVYPIPAKQTLNIEILNSNAAKYSILIHNALGQRVYQRDITVTSGNHVENVIVSGLLDGIYRLTILDQDKKKIKSSTIAIAK